MVLKNMESPAKHNLILITIDSLRSDHVSCYGYNRQTTPNIDTLTKQATLFENSYSNGPNTPNSFPSIMCSRYILELHNFKIPIYWNSIASILKKNGYNTIGFNSANSWLSKFFGYGKGFDIYNSYLEKSYNWEDRKFKKIFEGKEKIPTIKGQSTKSKKLKMRITKFINDLLIEDFSIRKQKLDKKFGMDVVDYIPKLKQPFFLWIHYMNVHYPYVPDKEYCIFSNNNESSNFGMRFLNYIVRFNLNLNNRIIRKIKNLYDDSIFQTDKNIGLILNILKKYKNFDNTMIVITSDHGECFKEHGNFSHYTYDVYNELLRVPLIIKYPKQKSSIKIKSQVSLINLLPTITNVLNLEIDSKLKNKALLLNKNYKNEVIFSEGYNLPSLSDLLLSATKLNTPKTYSIINNNWKLFIDFKHNRFKLFNLSSDPKEEVNLIKKNKDVLKNLTKLLEDHISQEKNRTVIEKKIHKKFKFNKIEK